MGVVVLICLMMSPPGRVLPLVVGVVVWPPPRFAGVSLGDDVACCGVEFVGCGLVLFCKSAGFALVCMIAG